MELAPSAWSMATLLDPHVIARGVRSTFRLAVCGAPYDLVTSCDQVSSRDSFLSSAPTYCRLWTNPYESDYWVDVVSPCGPCRPNKGVRNGQRLTKCGAETTPPNAAVQDSQM